MTSHSSRSRWTVVIVASAAALHGCDVYTSEPYGLRSPSTSIAHVATGAHACALTSDGIAYCWGYNGHGALGTGDTSTLVSPVPARVAGNHRFVAVSVSTVADVTCALTAGGSAYCWGENENGQLGDGSTTSEAVPTPVAGGRQFMEIAVGVAHVCALDTHGAVYCWGTSANGAFGDGSTGTRLTPTLGAPGTTLRHLVVGSDLTCGLTAEDVGLCWGLGASGQLGNDSTHSSATPVAVGGGLTFRTLAAGGHSVCGLTLADDAYCWGDNFYGTLGDGTSATETGTARRLAPVAVGGGHKFASIAAGYATMCGIDRSGSGFCWGYNIGSIGDGTVDHRSTPTAVVGGLAFQSIATGTGQSCGITASATYCWGDNINGGLGDGTLSARLTPTAVRWP